MLFIEESLKNIIKKIIFQRGENLKGIQALISQQQIVNE